MRISSSFYNKGRNTDSPTFKGVPLNPVIIPEFVGKVGKWAGEYIDSPEQRLFLGIGTLMFKPLIDLKYAEEDKRVDTALKSTAKALAGCFTGVTIRAAFLKLTDKFIGFNVTNTGLVNKQNILNDLFLPEAAKDLKNSSPAIANLYIKKYCNTLGSLFAILFMLAFSNSKIDVPLTNDLHDLFSGVVKDKKTWTKSLKDTALSRQEKIKNWFTRKQKFIEKTVDKTKEIADIIKDENKKTKGGKA